MARLKYSENYIMNLAERHNWNYIKTYLGDLGGDYGRIISFYRDQDDTTGTPCRVTMDICLTTGTVDKCKKSLADKNATRRIAQLENQVKTLRKQGKKEEKKRLADKDTTRRIKQLEDQVKTLRKQVANNKQEEKTLLSDMEVTGKDANKEKEEYSEDVPRIDLKNTDIILTTKHDEVIS